MKRRILGLFLAIVLMLGGALGLVGSAMAATTPTVSVVEINLSFRDALCVKFTVTTNSGAVPKLLYWTAPAADGEYVMENAKGVLETVGTKQYNGKTAYVFDYTGIAAKNIGDDIYIRPYVEVNGTVYYGSANKTSVLDYAYKALGITWTGVDDPVYREVIRNVLEYGAAAQEYFDYKTDRLVTDEFYQILTQNGTFSDGMAKGLYKVGTPVSLVAPATKNGKAFSHWETAEGVFLTDKAVDTVEAGVGHTTYVAVYDTSAAKVAFMDADGKVIATETVVDGAVSAPAAPLRKGYVFTGWDSALTGITASKTVKATYAAVENQIYFDYTETADILTVTVCVAGEVNLAGMDMKLGVTSNGLGSPTAVGLNGAMVNTVGKDVLLSYTAVQGVTEETALLTLTFAKTVSDASVSFAVEITDIFDASCNTVNYSVANNLYQ